MALRRVLIVNWRDIRNSKSGGAEEHIWNVFGAKSHPGCSVTLLSSGFRGARPEEVIDGIRVVRVGSDYTFPLFVPRYIQKLVRTHDPDLVLEVINKIPVMTPLWTSVPVAGFVHHLFGDAASFELPMPIAWTIRAGEALIPSVYGQCRILTGSESTRTELVEMGLFQERVHLTSYGVNTNAYSPGQKSSNPSLIYVGRLKRYKGIDFIIKLMPRLRKRYPELVLDIAGDGDARPYLEQLMQSLGLTHCVRFHGYVDEAAKRQMYQSGWAMCHLSRKEGFGLTIPEAALCSTPTIGFDVPGLCDSVKNGETGLLVPYGDIAALEAAVCKVLDDMVLRRRLGEAAKRHYRDFTWSAATDHTWRLLEEVAGSAVPSPSKVASL
ncbi:MAG: glycosyl transferase [Candidatus Hydrogenedentota bacterium]